MANVTLPCADLADKQAVRGFTLIELSITLVIIGLIVGGVLVGTSLIEQAGIRKQISQFSNYETALNTFKLNYNVVPGDMQLDQVTQFFGASLGYASCSGARGNGFIDFRVSDINNSCREPLHFHKQLGASGLVKGEFDGTFSRNGVPAAAIDESLSLVAVSSCCGVTQSQLSTAQEALQYTIALYVTYVNFSGAGQGVLSGTDSGLKPETVKNIDSKIDDGIARQGRVKAYTLRNNTGINTCLDATDGNYNVTTTRSCTLEYVAVK